MTQIPGLIDEMKSNDFEVRFLDDRRGVVFNQSSIQPRAARYFTKYGVQTMIQQLQAIADAMENTK